MVVSGPFLPLSFSVPAFVSVAAFFIHVLWINVCLSLFFLFSIILLLIPHCSPPPEFSKIFAAVQPILARVEKLADKLGVKPAQVALAWVLAKGVTSPIIGATKPHHLSDAIAALDIKLTDAQIASLEAPYAPRPVQGHS